MRESELSEPGGPVVGQPNPSGSLGPYHKKHTTKNIKVLVKYERQCYTNCISSSISLLDLFVSICALLQQVHNSQIGRIPQSTRTVSGSPDHILRCFPAYTDHIFWKTPPAGEDRVYLSVSVIISLIAGLPLIIVKRRLHGGKRCK